MKLLWLQNILKDVDAVLYVDTDVLFFSPLEDIWAHFEAFNSTQMAALAGEMEATDVDSSWYKNFARHPYYPPLGTLTPYYPTLGMLTPYYPH